MELHYRSSRRTHFTSAVLVLTTIGIIQMYIVEFFPPILCGCLCLFIGLFAYEFNIVHGPTMTRHKRASFDVSNVLETYQPRARTMGHLFQPEPPTPGNVTFAIGHDDDHDARTVSSVFKNARDSHYANEYELAMKHAKEMETLRKAADTMEFGTASDAPIQPTDSEEDRKHDEKKK